MPTDAEIPASALAVYAHPDDPEISAGGTLASWAEAGADVTVLITTQGDKGTQDPDADLGELARLRVEETAKAAALLGFSGHFHLGYHDGELPNDQELRAAITRYVRELRPQVVLCPDPTAAFLRDRYYNHRVHRLTGWATLDAVAPAAGNPHYFADRAWERPDHEACDHGGPAVARATEVDEAVPDDPAEGAGEHDAQELEDVRALGRKPGGNERVARLSRVVATTVARRLVVHRW